MIQWFFLSREDKVTALSQARIKSNITEKALEKDWWVTLVLKALFEGLYGRFLIFKGGTSLSKAWRLINRFSEDIDIALDPAAFAMEYLPEPTSGQLKRLKRAGCEFTSTALLQALSDKLEEIGLPPGTVTITAEEVPEDRQDKDPQVLFMSYQSLFEPNPYLADEVKIEVSVRSLKEPNARVDIHSLLNMHFPNDAYPETPLTVTVVEPTKTLLEKTFLLCEEFLKPSNKGGTRIKRMSRHFIDLVSMAAQGVDDHALADTGLYDAIIKHRRFYSRYTWFDYSMLERSKINFLPPDDLHIAYREDYEIMRAEMIYGASPTFEELVAALEILQNKFRNN